MFGGSHRTWTTGFWLYRWLETCTFSGCPGNELQFGYKSLLNTTHGDAENNKMIAQGYYR